MTIDLFHKVSYDCSKIVTENYSTSFSSAIQLLHKDLRVPIYNIYGFVRFADEIVDTFHQHNKIGLLDQFKVETFDAIEKGISLNPILNSFQKTVNQYAIDQQLIHEPHWRSILPIAWTAHNCIYHPKGYKCEFL